MGRNVLEILRQHFPAARFFYMLGNHEERFERYMKVKAPNSSTLTNGGSNTSLNFDAIRCELIDGKRVAKAGRLNSCTWPRIRTRWGLVPRERRSWFVHAREDVRDMWTPPPKTSEHTERDLDGETARTWSVGCLCELNPEYRPINKWNHGVAFVELDEDGHFTVHNRRIYNGSLN